jgi:hypothetical protein
MISNPHTSFSGSPAGSLSRRRRLGPFHPALTGFSGITTFVPPGLGFDAYHSVVVNGNFFFPSPVRHRAFRFGFNGFFSPCHHCFTGGPFIPHRVFLPKRYFFPFVPFFPTCAIVFTPGFINGSPFFFDQGIEINDAPFGSTSASDFTTSSFVPAPQPQDDAAPQSPLPLFLLVLKDHSIYGLTHYEIQNGRIYYATSYGALNSLPLALVDVESTMQMNRDRGLDFFLQGRPVNDP